MTPPNLLVAAKERVTIPMLWDLAIVPSAAPTRDGLVPINPLRDDRHPSFSLAEGGRVFVDFARDGCKGGVWDFIAHCRPQWSKAEIAAELKRRAGLSDVGSAARPRARKTVAKAAAKNSLQAWPASVAARWEEGLAFLAGNEERREKIAHKRGWPVAVVDHLVAFGLISYPILPWRDDRRGTAFLVQGPRRFPLGGIGLESIGYHQRFWITGKNGEEDRKAWVYVPNEKPIDERSRWPLQFTAQKCPALPFVIGDLRNARLLVICEGQWDAITLFHAAGWFEDAFPGRVAVLGVRGAQGVGTFFDYYRDAWPWKPAAWVLRDADVAGESWEPSGSWMPGKSFADRLGSFCSRVVVSSFRPEAGLGKDFNDAWRVKHWKAADIAQTLDKIGLGASFCSQIGKGDAS